MTMSLNENILLIFGIAFFTCCIILIIRLFFLSRNTTIIRTIFIYLLVYGGSISVENIFKYRNAPNYGISVGRAIGATIGAIAGFYLGYQIFVLSGIFDVASPEAKSPESVNTGNTNPDNTNPDNTNPNEPSAITFTLSFVSAEIGRLIGGFLGNFLFPV